MSMEYYDELEKRRRFQQILKDLAIPWNSQDDMDCFYGRLGNLYCDLVLGQSFRYYDSDIFSVVSGFSDSSDRAILAEQIVLLQQGYADYRKRYIDRLSVSDKLESGVHTDVLVDISDVLKV